MLPGRPSKGLSGLLVVALGMSLQAGSCEFPTEAAHSQTEDGLGLTLTAAPSSLLRGNALNLELRMGNLTDEDRLLTFTSGQKYEFLISRPEGEAVCGWSWDKAFTLAIEWRTLEAGGEWRVRETFKEDLPPGNYMVTGWFVCCSGLQDTVWVQW